MGLVWNSGVRFHDLRCLSTFIWSVVGLIMSHQVHLSYWVLYRVGPAKAASKQRQIARWLENSCIQPGYIYPALIRNALKDWEGECLYLALDSSQLWERFTVVRVALIYRGRALPISWMILTSQSATVAFETYRPILEAAKAVLPAHCSVVLLADRGFFDGRLLCLVRDLGWGFRIRLKSSFWVYRVDKPRMKVGTLMPAKGQALFLQKVWITNRWFGPVYLALAHVQTPDGFEKWAIVSDEPTSLKTLDEFGLRFDIEIVCTQITKTRGFTIGAGWDDVADFNFFIVNDHSINQQFYQFPALFKIQVIQGWLNTLAKLLDVVCQCKGLNLFLGLVFQLSQLLPEPVLSLSQFLALALKFFSQDDFRQIHFQETFLLAS
jgi:hypothetical protein